MYSSKFSTKQTKGVILKIDYRIWCAREMLQKRLNKTPSNARCFAQGSSLTCWPILEGSMGTADGAEELGLCSHGHACQADAWGHHHRVMPKFRIWPYLKNPNKPGKGQQKYSARHSHALSHAEILTNGFLWVNRRGTLQMRIAVSS
jgi:hypothetical protein